MTRAIHILSFILACLSGSSQIRPNISKIVNEIAIDNELDYSFVGEAAVTTEQYDRFIDLRDSATYDELMKLTRHENNVVRVYASWALIDQKIENGIEVFESFVKKNGELMAWEGCLGGETSVTYEFYQRVWGREYTNYATFNDSNYYSDLRIQLDSFVLFSGCCESLLRQVISNNNVNPARYEVIRKLALSNKNNYALVELASYGNSEDIKAIMKFKKEAFNAISEYPDNEFWSFLEKYSKSEKSKSYFMAVASFNNEKASLLLKNVLVEQELSEDEKEDLYEAVTLNNKEEYDDLLLYIFDNHQIIDMVSVRALIKRKKQKAALSFKTQLNSEKKLHLVNVGYNYGSKDSILYYMIDLVSETYPLSMDSICKTRIKTQYFTELTPFLQFISENNKSEMDAFILKRLKNERRAYETFHLTETYLKVSKQGEYEELISILTSNNDKWNKGNWASHFAELFEEHGLEYTTPATNSH